MYSGPIHIWSNASLGVQAVRISEGRFLVSVANPCHVYHDNSLYVLQGCTPLHLLHSEGCMLTSNCLRDVIQATSCHGVNFNPAVAIDSATRRPVGQYSELLVKETITLEHVGAVDCSRPRVWRCEGQLFATKHVERAILDAKILGLVFSEGVSSFLGSPGAG